MPELKPDLATPSQTVWDEIASDYEEFAEPFTRQFARAALNLSGGVAPDERVLDVAAGTGALTLAAASAGARGLATDFSPGMVARLSKHITEAGLAGTVNPQMMDGQALSLDNGSFDAAFSIFGVMLFPDWARGLAELARVLPQAIARLALVMFGFWMCQSRPE